MIQFNTHLPENTEVLQDESGNSLACDVYQSSVDLLSEPVRAADVGLIDITFAAENQLATVNSKYPELPKSTNDRSSATYYTCGDKVVYWTGKRLYCEHRTSISRCKICPEKQEIQHAVWMQGIKARFEERGCVLLTTTFQGKDGLYNYKCRCGKSDLSCTAVNIRHCGCKTCSETQRLGTLMSNYGVTNPFANKEIQQKIKETNLAKYGSENPGSNSQVKEKIKQTNLDKFQVENPFQNEDIKKKI